MKVRKVVTATACAAALTVVLLPAGLAFAESGYCSANPWDPECMKNPDFQPADPTPDPQPAPTPDPQPKPEPTPEPQPDSSTDVPGVHESGAWALPVTAPELPYATDAMVEKNEPFRPISEGTGIYNTDINSEFDMTHEQLSDYYYFLLINGMGQPEVADGIWKPYTMEELQSVVKRERLDVDAEDAWTAAAEKYLAEHNNAAPTDPDVAPATDPSTDQGETVQPVEVADATPATEVAAAQNSNSAVPHTSDALPFAAGAVALVGSALAVAGLKLRKNL